MVNYNAAGKNTGNRWYRIENKTAEVASVYLFDEIGYWGVTAADFVRELQDVTAGTLELHINSPGGDVFDGFAILNALRQHPARVVAVVDGLAASAASYIAVGAGDQVIVCRNAEVMIHEAAGMAMGPASEMTKMAQELEHFSDNIASIYAAKAGGTVADWRAVMKAETWYSAEEAVTAGLADRVDLDEPAKPKAAARRLVFNYAGRAAAPPPTSPARREPGAPEGGPAVQDQTLDALRQRLGVSEQVDEAGILAALDEALEEAADPPPAVPYQMPDDVRAQLNELQTLRNSQANAQRDAAITAAVREGRITPAERAGWEARYDASPTAALHALAALPEGRVPLTLLGRGLDTDGTEDPVYGALFGTAAGR